ncbi:hypothetical protein [Pandoraea communis]|uniref:hypothetical protein n=1 Tax=Pandoraea communis TaxID=2508297 RepID=UPI00123FC3F2|nr:hypothetical protein [Pandoraea communis]
MREPPLSASREVSDLDHWNYALGVALPVIVGDGEARVGTKAMRVRMTGGACRRQQKKAAERVGGATERVTAQPKLPKTSIGGGDDSVVTVVFDDGLNACGDRLPDRAAKFGKIFGKSAHRARRAPETFRCSMRSNA